MAVTHCRKTQLSVLLNNFCNLSCLYCYVGRETGKTKEQINLEFAKQGILDFFERYSSREIRFFAAGEPTLSFKMMRDIHDWVMEITDSGCRFELQTNGYFNHKIAQWVSQNIDICWISCDGMADIQNHYRPTIAGRPTSDIIEKNISFLSSESLVLGCRATITPKNVGRQIEMVDYFKRLGVKAVMSDPMFASVSESDSMSQNDRRFDLLDYAKNFLEARKYAEKVGVFYGSIFTVNFDEKTDLFCRACVPYPHLLPDGFVSCCDMASSGRDQKMKDLIYGEYDSQSDVINYDQDKIKKIQSRVAGNLPHCKNCEVLNNCAGACLGEALNETGSMFGIKPQVCEAIRYLASNMQLNAGLYPFLHP